MVNVRTLIATWINADGYREILGGDEHRRDGAGLTFWRPDRPGSEQSWSPAMPCRPGRGDRGRNAARRDLETLQNHYTANLIRHPENVAVGGTLLHSVFDQPDAESVHAHPSSRALADRRPPEAARDLGFTAPSRHGARSGRTIPTSGSTGDPPPRSASSPTATPCASSAGLADNTTNGPSAAATSAWRSANPEDTAHRQNRRPQRH